MSRLYIYSCVGVSLDILLRRSVMRCLVVASRAFSSDQYSGCGWLDSSLTAKSDRLVWAPSAFLAALGCPPHTYHEAKRDTSTYMRQLRLFL